jgi:hypothetical protein
MRNRYADLVALGMAVVLVIAALLFASAARGAPHATSPSVHGATGLAMVASPEANGPVRHGS